MKSRRKDLRYGDFQYKVTIRTAYEEGNCLLKNISTSGCALEKVPPILSMAESFLLVIDTDVDKGLIEARGKVIRITYDSIGVTFTRISRNSQNLIRNHFTKTLRNRKFF